MALDHLWTDPPGFFARASYAPDMRIAFANYGVSLGLQATGVWPDRVDALHAYFERYRSGDAYDRDAITHVMACTSHLPGAFLARRSAERRVGTECVSTCRSRLSQYHETKTKK